MVRVAIDVKVVPNDKRIHMTGALLVRVDDSEYPKVELRFADRILANARAFIKMSNGDVRPENREVS